MTIDKYDTGDEMICEDCGKRMQWDEMEEFFYCNDCIIREQEQSDRVIDEFDIDDPFGEKQENFCN